MGAQIIVVDDDPIVGGLTLELLQDAGYEVALVQDSLKAQEIIRADKPVLVVLDILMPGLDGLTLLHRLKSDPETSGIKAIVVSGKSFEAEKARAAQYGAEAFIEKPYDVDTFAQKVAAIMTAGGVQAVRAPVVAAAQPEPPAPVSLTVWGCRSSSPQDAPPSERYGRRTSCVAVETGGRRFIFDAGSGIAFLGKRLAKEPPGSELWLFLTHFHVDHVEGLAGFVGALPPGVLLNISASSDPDKPLEQAVHKLLEPAFEDQPPAARLELYGLIEQNYELLPGVRLSPVYANHPGTTMGFQLAVGGRRIVYCPDSEIYGDEATALQDYDEKLGRHCRGADVLLHDGRYTQEDYEKNRNQGHSSALAAVDFAVRNEVKRLVLVHLDARYSDDELDLLEKLVRERADGKTDVMLGREGLRLTL